MIPRYTRKDMLHLWTDSYRYNIWVEIELLVCKIQEQHGMVPPGIHDKLCTKINFDIDKIIEYESSTKHDVTAFLKSLYDYTGDDGKHLHKGMTSSDLLDTGLSIQLKHSTNLILKGIDDLLETLKAKAYKYKDLICIGRTHGIHADPLTIGMKFARFYAEIRRNKMRLLAAQDEILICKLSGATGTFANITPDIEQQVAEKLGLKIETIATQVIPRDRHAFLISTIAILATSIENIALEIRNLHRTELSEVEEYFSPGQMGSSSMPHKKNPILSENLTGLARLIRNYVTSSLQNIPLWHERDISHSSVERCMFPDVFTMLDFMLHRINNVITMLVIKEENVKKNLQMLHGIIFSQRILLELINTGLDRNHAYNIIQQAAHLALKEEKDFYQILSENKDVTSLLNKDKLASLFDISHYTKHVDVIFDRVFNLAG